MFLTRRSFLEAAAATAMLPGDQAAPPHSQQEISGDRFDPWVEVSLAALAGNVATVRALVRNRPILAVIKNNAYGLGLIETARSLQTMDGVEGFAVVKTDAAHALRDAGISIPILHMGMASDRDTRDMAARNIQVSVYTDLARRRVADTSSNVQIQFYLDTGLGRMGRPFRQALDWMAEVVGIPGVRVAGSYMAFTEDTDFDVEQLARMRALLGVARNRGIPTGTVHAASSNGVFHLPGAHFDQVRPGIALFGAYPSRPEEERAIAELTPAVRLRARVVRVARLEPGDGVSYGRRYVADRPTWVATLPAGHTDGVPRQAVDGAVALIGDRLFPFIGAVSASHSIVEVGDEPTVTVGDVATIMGPDHPAIHPNAIAAATGVSVYDLLMHLDPTLPRIFV